MIIHSDTSYLSETKALSRSRRDFFIGYQNFKNTGYTNGAVHTVYNIIENVIGYATEA